MRRQIYESLADNLREIRPSLEIGLCLEASSMFDALAMKDQFGQCNCVL
jgi:hypothetical protein